MSRKKKTEAGKIGINIGGNVNTGGGDIVVGDVNKRNVYQNSTIDFPTVKRLFQPAYAAIEELSKESLALKPELVKAVDDIQGEVVKREKADSRFVEGRLRNITKMSNDIAEVVITILANPVLGLGLIARKIVEKAEDSSEDVKKNE